MLFQCAANRQAEVHTIGLSAYNQVLNSDQEAKSTALNFTMVSGMPGIKQTGNTGCRGITGPGRPKGSQNKVTSVLKDAILIAGENAGSKFGNDGLVSYLQEQAIQNPTENAGAIIHQ